MEIEKSNVNIKLTLVIKYISMAVLIGIIVGIVDTIFGRGLLAISDFRTANYKYLIPFLPIAGLFIVWMYSYFSKVSLKGMRFSLDLIETAYNKLMTSVQYTGEVSFFTRYEFFASYISSERKCLQTR